MIVKPTPQERAMRMHELLVRTLAGEFSWIEAAALGSVDLDQILCFEEERVVLKDNTVGCEGARLQVPKQPDRATCSGLLLTVRRHLDHSYSVWRGSRCLATYDPRGRLRSPETAARKAA